MRTLTLWQRRLHLEAIKAAIHRTKPGLCSIELTLEVKTTWREIRVDSKGHLYWRGCTLGRQLFIRLSEAQNWRCCYCGVRVVIGEPLDPRLATLEHIVPKCFGGNDHPDNLAMACACCNNNRGTEASRVLAKRERQARRDQSVESESTLVLETARA
jgi:5-methylcytosine-specific restriction endonuclease McrA